MTLYLLRSSKFSFNICKNICMLNEENPEKE